MLLYGNNSCGASEAFLCLDNDNEVQVTICKHTDHLYVCMVLTVRQSNEAKSPRKVTTSTQLRTHKQGKLVVRFETKAAECKSPDRVTADAKSSWLTSLGSLAKT